MRPRTLLVLFLVVAGLAAFVWFIERDLPSSEDRREQSRKLVVLDPGEVDEVVLDTGGERVHLERVADRDSAVTEWRLVDPPLGRADAEEVLVLLEGIADLEKQRTLEEGSREELGLTQPRARVRLGGESVALTLSLGSRVPASENSIAEVGAGPPFYVVSDSFFSDIARGPDEWRSRDAVPVERDRIRMIDVLLPAPGLSLAREDGDSNFELLAPVEDEADESRVRKLVSGVVDMEIEEFLDAAGAAPELESPAASVRIRVEGSDDPIDLSIAPRDTPDGAAETADSASAVAVRVDGRTFLAKTDLAAQLAVPALAWRSPKWSAHRTFEIEAVEILQPGESMTLARSEGQWLSDGSELPYATADGLLRSIVDATGTPTDTSLGPDAVPELEIKLVTADAEENLRLFRASAGGLAERLDRRALLRLEEDTVEKLLAKLEELRAASVAAAEDDPESMSDDAE
ncbi:MAG: DUF4340 domain-containing protein [Thermoanaerobaculia bacterium]